MRIPDDDGREEDRDDAAVADDVASLHGRGEGRYPRRGSMRGE